jgi:zinc transporter ZupT
MIIFNYALFLSFVAAGWVFTGASYLLNGIFIEKETARKAASLIVGIVMMIALILCMVL